jgi:hypothetical protein
MRSIALLAALVAALTLSPPLVAAATAAATDWSWPVRGDVVAPYRNGDDPYAAGQHRGVDIAAPVGTPVAAAAAGSVTYVGVAGSSGLTVSVRTADGRYDTSYLHLAAATVREGDDVDRGERIGSVGVSGRGSSAQPHLHFGVRDAGSEHSYRDPLGFLPPLARPASQPQPPATAPAPVAAAPPAGAPVRTPPAGPAAAPAPAPLLTPLAGADAVRVPAAGIAVAPPTPAAAHPAAHPAAPSAGPRPAPGPATAHVSSAPTGTARPSGHRGRPERAASSRAHGHLPATGSGNGMGAGPRRSSGTRTIASVAAPGVRRPAHAAPTPPAGLDVGWLAALVGLVLAATCLGRPAESRRAVRGARAALAGVLRPSIGRG